MAENLELEQEIVNQVKKTSGKKKKSKKKKKVGGIVFTVFMLLYIAAAVFGINFGLKFLWNYIKSRLPLLLLAFCIVTCAVASMVYAKYVDDNQGNASINITTGGKLTLDVSDPVITGNNYEYKITNASDGSGTDSSNVTAYIRFAVVVNWQDSEGNMWAVPPKVSDYRIAVTDCSTVGDYYYYNGIRNPGDSFTVSVALTAEANPPAGFDKLHVQIVAEGIQSVPLSAAETAWKATFNGSTWVEKS